MFLGIVLIVVKNGTQKFRHCELFVIKNLIFAYKHEIVQLPSGDTRFINKICIGRELNPGLPRGRREFYH